MPLSRSLTVVVPRTLEQLQDSSDGSHEGLDVLAFIAGKGRLERRWPAQDPAHARLQAWQYGLLAMLALDERGEPGGNPEAGAGDYPSAATCALGVSGATSSNGVDSSADWLHVEPIHLAAGLNEVTLVPLHEAIVTNAERDAITAALHAHLQADGFTLQPYADGEWLLRLPRALEAQTVTSAFAARSDWRVALPQGRDAPTLRRLMTELQMLLHDLPLNAARQARGAPAINALWLWGNGAVNVRPRAARRYCMGSHAYLRGVCLANGWQTPRDIESIDSAVESARAHPGSVLVANDRMVATLGEGLSRLLAALRRGRLARLDLVIDQWWLSVDRWTLRRVWRRALPLADWTRA